MYVSAMSGSFGFPPLAHGKENRKLLVVGGDVSRYLREHNIIDLRMRKEFLSITQVYLFIHKYVKKIRVNLSFQLHGTQNAKCLQKCSPFLIGAVSRSQCLKNVCDGNDSPL